MILNTNILPNEILLEIFKSLSIKDIICFTSADRRLSELRPVDFIKWRGYIVKCNSVIKQIDYSISNLISSRKSIDSSKITTIYEFIKYNGYVDSPWNFGYRHSIRDVFSLTACNWSGRKMRFSYDRDLWEIKTWDSGTTYFRSTYNFPAYLDRKISVIEDEDHYSITINNY